MWKPLKELIYSGWEVGEDRRGQVTPETDLENKQISQRGKKRAPGIGHKTMNHSELPGSSRAPGSR